MRSQAAALAATLIAISFAFLAAACGAGYGSTNPPPPSTASEIFIVNNFSGDVSAFSAASGKLTLITGSSAAFPPFITQSAVESTGNFLAAVTTTASQVSTLQLAKIGAGGIITVTPATSPVTNSVALAISSQGVIAVTDPFQQTVQLLLIQNNALVAGPSAATGPLPQDAVFSGDGSRLYVGNNAGGTISVFTVSMQGAALQPAQTAALPVAAGEFLPNVVRVALSPNGKKFAATTPDGRLFVGDVSSMDGTLSGFTEAHTAANANLHEVAFDPSGQNVYAADLDNGGIFGFTISAAGLTPVAGSPFSTGTLPGGPSGMAFNSAGDRLYVVLSAQSSVLTFSRNTGNGSLTATGDVVSSGGQLAKRIVRVPEH